MLETAWESRWVPDYSGDIAQLGEHLPCKQGVRGSNPLISTVLTLIFVREYRKAQERTLKTAY